MMLSPLELTVGGRPYPRRPRCEMLSDTNDESRCGKEDFQLDFADTKPGSARICLGRPRRPKIRSWLNADVCYRPEADAELSQDGRCKRTVHKAVRFKVIWRTKQSHD